ncbi:alpha/beta hydrolase [Lentibacter sp. XHP0401]|uniref:alpha/beta hydrolase n=1 Tax=Lentibacter sp. XHP0401 TaxID=2984334 RepID=UPI0021E77D88|nr:alpha/beta fold hydrolase [Lentibacter sp. XHP0401]MCV2891534.1 alpha/beta fold hydrolase [Lentibacter sp. XHP0401]
MLYRIFLFIMLIVLAACTRPQAVGFSAPVPEATVKTIFIATMRTEGQSGQIFGERRSAKMSYAQAEISIPPHHEVGKIERGTGVVDARRHFAPLGAEPLKDAPALATRIRKASKDQDEPLLIFVHGYNNTLEDAAFRLAQIQHDFELTNPALLFSWPSAGDPLGYAYDRDSVLFARSDFARLLEDLNRSGQRRVIILAHSMGSYLVMESLRQMALQGKSGQVNALEAVILMSPDIDPDVFRQQAREIGKLPQPFIIMTSQKDRALNVAGLLTGRKERLGRIQNAEEVEGLEVSVLDFSLFEAGGGLGHMVPVSSPAAIQFMRRFTSGVGLAAEEFSRYVLLGESRRDGRLLQ